MIPVNIDIMTHRLPEYLSVTGRVISPEEEAPHAMGTNFPKYLVKMGDMTKVEISLKRFVRRAIMPNVSCPICVMIMLDKL